MFYMFASSLAAREERQSDVLLIFAAFMISLEVERSGEFWPMRPFIVKVVARTQTYHLLAMICIYWPQSPGKLHTVTLRGQRLRGPGIHTYPGHAKTGFIMKPLLNLGQ